MTNIVNPGYHAPWQAGSNPSPSANSPEQEAAEAQRLADRVNAERAALGLEPLEPPAVPAPADDLSPEAGEAAQDAPVAPAKPAPVREPAKAPAEDGQVAKGYLPPRA
jgi:hypothetical protein